MKSKRQSLILELLDKYDIETQAELAERLRENGYNVTQATISRDIKELRQSKALSDDMSSYKYATIPKAELGMRRRFISIFSQSMVSAVGAGNLIVVKTITGAANAAAEAIDSLNIPEAVGTLAGDNTIFIAVRNADDVPGVLKKLQSLTD